VDQLAKEIGCWLAAPVKTAAQGRALLERVKSHLNLNNLEQAVLHDLNDSLDHLKQAILCELGDLQTAEEEIDCLCQALDRWQP
jgi:hypothetical protein